MKERSRRPLLKVIARIARTTTVNKTIVAHANKTIASKTIVARVHKTIASKTIVARVHKVVSKVVSPAVSQVSNRVHVLTTTQQIAIAIATVVVVKGVVTMKAHREPTVTKSTAMFQTIQ
jgi:hypothetical protein